MRDMLIHSHNYLVQHADNSDTKYAADRTEPIINLINSVDRS